MWHWMSLYPSVTAVLRQRQLGEQLSAWHTNRACHYAQPSPGFGLMYVRSLWCTLHRSMPYRVIGQMEQHLHT